MKLPPPLNLIWNGWMKFSHILGKIMSTIILTVLWIVGFGVYAVIVKLCALFQNKSHDTYWITVSDDQDNNLRYPF